MRRRNLLKSLMGGLFSGRMLPARWQAKPEASPLVSNQHKITFDRITIPRFTKDVLELRTICDSIASKPTVPYRDSKDQIIEVTQLIQVVPCTMLPGEVNNSLFSFDNTDIFANTKERFHE